MTTLVAVAGIILLIGFALAVGTEMDTELQRIERREVARERRLRNDQLHRLRDERLRLEEERRRLREERTGERAPGWCSACPLWDRFGRSDDEA
jgi:hypothetical protein